MEEHHRNSTEFKACCRNLARALESPNFPLSYNSGVEEVQLHLDPIKGRAAVHWCPFCGQGLTSGRWKLFTDPHPDDVRKMKSALLGLSSIAEVIAKLGSADESGSGDGSGPEGRPWKEWVRYRRHWKSLELTVGEFPEGGIDWLYSGQLR